MRAFWAATIAFCLLLAGGRPIEPDLRPHDRAQLDVATHPCVTPSVRRSSSFDADLRPLFVVPTFAAGADAPLRHPVELASEPASTPVLAVVSISRSSRGPPRA